MEKPLILALDLDTTQRDRLMALRDAMIPSADCVASLDPLARSDLELAVQTGWNSGGWPRRGT